MGDDIGSGLSSMSFCFDFRSTNIVQLSNRNPYFYRLRCHHPLITQLTYSSISVLFISDHGRIICLDKNVTSVIFLMFLYRSVRGGIMGQFFGSTRSRAWSNGHVDHPVPCAHQHFQFRLRQCFRFFWPIFVPFILSRMTN